MSKNVNNDVSMNPPIVKTLGISQIVYSASMLDISPNDTSRMKKFIFSFIWNKEPDKIKRNIMCQDYTNGGLRAQ